MFRSSENFSGFLSTLTSDTVKTYNFYSVPANLDVNCSTNVDEKELQRKRNQRDCTVDLDLLSEQNAVKRSHLLSSNFDSDSDLPPQEMIFSIDHIMEKILAGLNIPDLLNCRLVCLKWKAVATVELRKQVGLSFKGNSLQDCCIHRCAPWIPKTIPQLSELSQHSDQFPCNKFEVCVGNFREHNILQNFLNRFGCNINELTLRYRKDSEFVKRVHEKVIMKQIVALLLFQTPNLEYLTLDVDAQVDWNMNGWVMDEFDDLDVRGPLRTTDIEFKEIHCNKILARNTKLKILRLWNNTKSSKIVELIIHLSPNLVEVIPGFENVLYSYLLEPLNRIYLLKTVCLDLDCMEKVERISNASRQCQVNLQLRQVEFALENISSKIEKDPTLETRVIDVMNTFLGSSWNSLEKIRWNGVACFIGLKWPELMPRLKRLELGCPNERIGDLIFPHGFSPSKAFPKLHSVYFFSFDQRACLVQCFGQLEKLTSVRNVCLETDCMISPWRLKYFQDVFPNAEIFANSGSQSRPVLLKLTGRD